METYKTPLADIRYNLECFDFQGRVGSLPGFEDYDLESYPGTVHEDGVQAMIDLIRESRETLTLIAVGGTGRGDPAPYSDVDLLFLTESSLPTEIDEWIKQLIRDFWDAGLNSSHSRSISSTK